MTRRLTIDPENPDSQVIQEVATSITNGKLVVPDTSDFGLKLI